MEYAHGQGVLHRDIKSSNLLLDLHGTVWVTDFGLAKMEDERGLTQTGDVLGTLRYMAPETFKGQADARSEVYSLGLTLYELLAFRPAFDQTQRSTLVDQVMNAQVEPLCKLNREIPSDLQRIVHKAIDRDPEHRYQTAGELAEDLQRFIDDEPIKARRVSSVERLARWSRHNKGLAAALATVSLLITVLAIGSTIAAGYFRNLSGALTIARNSAQENAAKNLQLANEKEKARVQAVKSAEREQSLARAANEAAARVKDQSEINRRNLYYAQMQLAQQAWGLVRGIPRMASMLDRWQSQASGADLRGWEWFYLKSGSNTPSSSGSRQVPETSIAVRGVQTEVSSPSAATTKSSGSAMPTTDGNC